MCRIKSAFKSHSRLLFSPESTVLICSSFSWQWVHAYFSYQLKQNQNLETPATSVLLPSHSNIHHPLSSSCPSCHYHYTLVLWSLPVKIFERVIEQHGHSWAIPRIICQIIPASVSSSHPPTSSVQLPILLPSFHSLFPPPPLSLSRHVWSPYSA